MLRATLLAVLLVVAAEAVRQSSRDDWEEFEDFLEWKRWKKLQRDEEEGFRRQAVASSNGPSYGKRRQNPPPIKPASVMGRYIVNQADWCSVATISTRKDIRSFPFVSLLAMCDGPLGNGSGIPYVYLTPWDFSGQDVAKDRRVSLMMTLAQGNYCKDNNMDPMDPRCAKIFLTGLVTPVKNGTAEYAYGKNCFAERHSNLRMPESHGFYLAKVKLMSIVVQDYFGGPSYISVQEYLHPPTPNITEEFRRHFPSRKW